MGWEHFLPGILFYLLLALLAALAWATLRKHGGKAGGPLLLVLAAMFPGDGRQGFFFAVGLALLAHGHRAWLQDRWWARVAPGQVWRQRSWRYEGPVGPLLEACRRKWARQSRGGRNQATWRWLLGAYGLAWLFLVAGGISRPGQSGIAWDLATTNAAFLALLAGLVRWWWLKRKAQGPGPEAKGWAEAWLPLLEQAHPDGPVVASREGRPVDELPHWQQKGRPIWDEAFGSFRRHVRFRWWSLTMLLPNGAACALACDRATKSHSKWPDRARDRWRVQVLLRWPAGSSLDPHRVRQAWGQAPPRSRPLPGDGPEPRAIWRWQVQGWDDGSWQLQATCEGDRRLAGSPEPEQECLRLLAWLEQQRVAAERRAPS